jgi:phenylpropionate dioxygenase-like ring-hydroxylating dioxygenase large terminal subunit
MLSLERFEMDALRIGASSEWVVEANWKIIIENYSECLHCPTVHPELVNVIPAYREGWVLEDGRDDGGVWLAEGGTYAPGVSTLQVLPTMSDVDARSVYGGAIFNQYLGPGTDANDDALDVSDYLTLSAQAAEAQSPDDYRWNTADLKRWVANAAEQKDMDPDDGRGMLPFPQLTDEQLDQVVAYLATLD